MNLENNLPFSDIPALDDTAGLETFMQNETLKSQGLTPTTPITTTPTQPEQPTQPEVPANPQAQQGGIGGLKGIDPSNLTQEQVSQILTQVNNINNKLADVQQRTGQYQRTPQPQAAVYSPEERKFIEIALNKGYDINSINATIMQRRQQLGVAQNPNLEIERRMAAVENYLRSQEYKTAETAFITKLNEFGSKWGLSEQDLVTFGNAALEKGITIAMPNVELETVFRAVYPEQYAIRAQRMTPTNTSQIYGGISAPEGNRQASARAEDAYVDAFLKGAMPNQYGMLNKK